MRRDEPQSSLCWSGNQVHKSITVPKPFGRCLLERDLSSVPPSSSTSVRPRPFTDGGLSLFPLGSGKDRHSNLSYRPLGQRRLGNWFVQRALPNSCAPSINGFSFYEFSNAGSRGTSMWSERRSLGAAFESVFRSAGMADPCVGIPRLWRWDRHYGWYGAFQYK